MGVQKLAFPSIVASGPNSSFPHYEPGDRKLEKGDLVIIDMGVEWRGYCSDMTRTIAIGPVSTKARRLYNVVKTAQSLGVKSAKPGIQARTLDRIVRRFLKEKNYKREFMHGLGHSLGLEIHEAPALNFKSTTRLMPGMVVTIEPGVYISGFGGVRIEDTILLRDGKPEIFTQTPKELVVI
jgi:Xaa-Pro aminopeptidase